MFATSLRSWLGSTGVLWADLALHPAPAACLMRGNVALLIKSVPVAPRSQQETLHFYTPISENNARIVRVPLNKELDLLLCFLIAPSARLPGQLAII